MSLGNIIAQNAMIDAQIQACNAEIVALKEKIERLQEALLKLKEYYGSIEDIKAKLAKKSAEQERWEGDKFNRHKEQTQDEVLNPIGMYLKELDEALNNIENKIRQLKEEISALHDKIKSLNAMKASLVSSQ